MLLAERAGSRLAVMSRARVGRSLLRKVALSAAVCLGLSVLPGTAHAVSGSIPGGSATVTSTWAKVCGYNGYNITLYWAQAVVAGHETGGSTWVRSGFCVEHGPTVAGARFYHFHLCNSSGYCGPEIRV